MASQPSIKITWLLGTLAVFALFAVIAAYSSRMSEDYPDYDQQRTAQRYGTLAKVRADAQKTLTTADWIDQTKGTLHIPIEEAMVEEVDALKGKPVAMGAALPAPASAPAAPAVPAAGATNAAPTMPSTPAAKNPAASAPAAPGAATPAPPNK